MMAHTSMAGRFSQINGQYRKKYKKPFIRSLTKKLQFIHQEEQMQVSML